MGEKFGFLGHDHAYNIIKTNDGALFFNGFLDVTASNGLGQNKIFQILRQDTESVNFGLTKLILKVIFCGEIIMEELITTGLTIL